MMSKFPIPAKAERFVRQVNAKPTTGPGPMSLPTKPIARAKPVDVAALKAACVRFLPL